MNNTTRIKLITIALTLAGTILAVGDKITTLPLPGYVTSAWPFIYSAAILFDRIAHILWPDVAANTVIAPWIPAPLASTSGPANPLMSNPPVQGPNIVKP